MSLQLPAKAAPPSNYGRSNDKPAQDKGKGKEQHETLTPKPRQQVPKHSPAYITRSTRSSNDHRAFGSVGATTAPEQDILEIQNIRRLEDMLLHCEALLGNRSLCALLPAGKAPIEARQALLKLRLDHLYSVQRISHQLHETSLDTTDSAGLKKEENADPDSLNELEKLSISNNKGEAGATTTSPSASPYNPRRTWKQDILNRASSQGRMTQLSLSESLALQEKESHRVQMERLAILKREEEEEEEERLKLADLSKAGLRGGRGRGAADGRKKVTFGSAAAYNDAPASAQSPDNMDDSDEYDWHTEGYYHDEEG